MFNIHHPIKIDWEKISKLLEAMKKKNAIKKIKKPCECGGEKAKTTHSIWCPKYEED